jgi:hypothetical protein
LLLATYGLDLSAGFFLSGGDRRRRERGRDWLSNQSARNPPGPEEFREVRVDRPKSNR